MHKVFSLFSSTLLTAAMAIAHSTASASDSTKYVLVTGTSTGIGRNLTETLAKAGYHVYASVRNGKDFKELNALDRVTAVMLDVTDQSQVDAAAAQIADSGTGLHGLVNNAGVGGGGTVMDTPVEEQTFVYNVNVEGVYRVTKAFAPLIAKSKGRIVTTGSIAGTLSWADGTAYSGSKHWIEGFTDALAEEMAPLGVSVSVVEPGNYQSHIRRNAVKRRLEQIKAAGGEVTPEMEKMYAQTEQVELSYKIPDEVSAAFMHALFDDAPLRRYVVVPSAEEQGVTIGGKIQQLVELNTWGPYSYSRDQLVEMLDQALAAKNAEASP